MSLEEFNRKFSATLEVDLSQDTVPISPGSILMNEKADPNATIQSLHLDVNVWEEDKEDYRDPTTAELDEIVLVQPTLKLRGITGQVVQHRAPNRKCFTARDILAAVEKTEKLTRGHSQWFGGVDVHHVYFEGIHIDDHGVYRIYWGS